MDHNKRKGKKKDDVAIKIDDDDDDDEEETEDQDEDDSDDEINNEADNEDENSIDSDDDNQKRRRQDDNDDDEYETEYEEIEDYDIDEDDVGDSHIKRDKSKTQHLKESKSKSDFQRINSNDVEEYFEDYNGDGNNKQDDEDNSCEQCLEKFLDGCKFMWKVLIFLLDHPTWRMRKRQATVLTACLCMFANILPIFMSKTTPNSVYERIYRLSPGEIGLEGTMFFLDITLICTAYSGVAWYAIPWLTIAPMYWCYQIYLLITYMVEPPDDIYKTFKLYDVLIRSIVYLYLYAVVYSAFGYLVTKLQVGIEYNPQDEHVPIITKEVIEQMETIAKRQGMSAPEALLYIYKRTGKNWGVTATALQFDPNASLPKYRGK